jgi:putative ABC transport system permease protein
VRQTLGATHEQLAANLLTELLLLVAIAAVVGLLVATLALEVLAPFLDATLPRGGGIAIDVGALGFAIVAVTGAALLTCAMPLRRALLGDAASTLRAGPQELLGARRNTAVPAIGLGLATAAIASALALSVSLLRLSAVEPGFRTADIAALQIFRPVPDVARFTERAFAEIRNIPGVSNVSAVRSPPLDQTARFAMRVAPARAVESPISVDVQRAAAGYHAFLRIPILRGRDISERDGSQAPKVVVINETLAERVFGASDPVGQQLAVFIEGEPVPFEVIGVARDVRNVGLRVPTNPEATVSMAQLPQWPFSVTLLVESAISPAAIMPGLQEAIRRVDSGQAISRSFTFVDELAAQTRQAGLFARMSSGFAALALLLGLIGVHAVVSAMVGRRRREIGLRLALGATPGNAATLVFASAARITAYGTAIGGMLAAPTLAYLQGELFGIDTMSLVAVFAGTALTLMMTSFAASGLSAWRAARIPPMDALRSP